MSIRPRRRSRTLLTVLLLAGLGAVTLGLVTRRVTPPPQSSGSPPLLPPIAQSPAAPSAEAEGHPVFDYPAPPIVARPQERPSPTVSAGPRRSPSRPAARREPSHLLANPPDAAPSQPRPQGGRPAQVARGEGSGPDGSSAQGNPPAAAAPPGPLPVATAEGPSGDPTPAASGATPPAAGTGSSPTLRPPVPLEQPPLHPVLRATITSGPGGGSAVEEAAVRGRVKIRLLVRSDGAVASVEVVVSSGDAALDEAARLGPLRWRFAPATRDGVPIDAYLLLWITFSG